MYNIADSATITSRIARAKGSSVGTVDIAKGVKTAKATPCCGRSITFSYEWDMSLRLHNNSIHDHNNGGPGHGREIDINFLI